MHSNDGLTPEVLHDLLMRSATAKDRALILAFDREDREYWMEDLTELAWRLVDEVFSLDWCTGSPGAGAGTERVYRLADKYLTAFSECEWGGPYDSLDDALGEIGVNCATRAIWCSEWSEEEIIARMKLYDPPRVIALNGEDWPFETLEHKHQTLTGRKAG